MVTKFGKIKAIRNDGSMMTGAFELEISVINIGGRNFTITATTNDESGITNLPYKTNMYRGINVENKDHLMLLLNVFAPNGIKSYEWLEPLTEVK